VRSRQPAAGATCCCSRISWEAAIESWQRIEQQDPTYLALVAQRLLDAFRKLERRDEGLRLLRGYLEHYPSLDLLDVVFQLVLEGDGAEAAYKLVRDELKRNPTLLGFDKLLEARLLFAAAENPSRSRTGERDRSQLHASPGALSVR
jgi:lipopolysaccharide biosynthesis regulator YciM